MPPTEAEVEQVREALATKSPRPAGRHRAESAVTARWLRALRSTSDPRPEPRS